MWGASVNVALTAKASPEFLDILQEEKLEAGHKCNAHADNLLHGRTELWGDAELGLLDRGPVNLS